MDACQLTHTHVRARARGGTVVHAQDSLSELVLSTGRYRFYLTACGCRIPKDEAIRTAAGITCRRDGCIRAAAREKHERPGGLTVRAGRTKVLHAKKLQA